MRLTKAFTISFVYIIYVPIPVAAWSKAWVCCRSLAGIAGSNSAGGTDVCVLWMFCVLSGRGLCDGPITRPEEYYRVWRVWVWSRSLDNKEALARAGLSSHEKNIIYVGGIRTFISCTGIYKTAMYKIITQKLWWQNLKVYQEMFG